MGRRFKSGNWLHSNYLVISYLQRFICSPSVLSGNPKKAVYRSSSNPFGNPSIRQLLTKTFQPGFSQQAQSSRPTYWRLFTSSCTQDVSGYLPWRKSITRKRRSRREPMVLFLRRSGYQAQEQGPPRLRDISAFVIERIGEELSVERTAMQAAMSPRTRRRWCRQHLNESPAQKDSTAVGTP